MAKTNYFDDLYIGGDVEVVGTTTFGAISVVGNLTVDGVLISLDGSTSVISASAGYVSTQADDIRLGLDADDYMMLVTSNDTANLAITHPGNTGALVIWTAGGWTLTGAFEIVGSATLDDTLISTTLGIGTDLSMIGTTGVHDWFLADSVADALSIQRGTTDMIVFNTSTPLITITPNTSIVGDLDVDGVTNLDVVDIDDEVDITIAAGSTSLETALDIDVSSSTVEANNYGIDLDVTQASIIADVYLSRGNLQGVRSDCVAIGNIDHVYATRSGASIAMTADSETNQFYGGIFSAAASGAHTLTLHDGLVGFQSTVTVDSGVTDVTGGLVAAAFFNSEPIGKDLTSPTYGVYVKSGGYTDFGQSIQVESNNLTSAMRIQATDSAVLPIGLQFSTQTASMTVDIELQNGETLDNATDGFINAQAGFTSYAQSVVLNHRQRVTTAEINAGHELLPAIAGRAYRIVSVRAIAYGGAVGATTTVDLLGTQSAGGVKLVTFARADLIQSAVLTDAADGTILADGASYVACDVTTAITVGKTDSDVTTATGVDFIITYVIE